MSDIRAINATGESTESSGTIQRIKLPAERRVRRLCRSESTSGSSHSIGKSSAHTAPESTSVKSTSVKSTSSKSTSSKSTAAEAASACVESAPTEATSAAKPASMKAPAPEAARKSHIGQQGTGDNSDRSDDPVLSCHLKSSCMVRGRYSAVISVWRALSGAPGHRVRRDKCFQAFQRRPEFVSFASRRGYRRRFVRKS